MYESLGATEYDSNCNAISSTPTFTETATLTTVTPNAPNLPTSDPTQPTFFGTNAGPGTITATFADGTVGTLGASTYTTITLSCSTFYYGNGISIAADSVHPDMEVATSPNSQTNYCTGASPVTTPTQLPDGSTLSGDGIVFPYGYEIIAGSNVYTLANLTTAGSFIPSGYGLTFQQLENDTYDTFVVRTFTGQLEKIGVLFGGCQGLPTDTTCLHPGAMIALQSALADSSGAFPY